MRCAVLAGELPAGPIAQPCDDSVTRQVLGAVGQRRDNFPTSILAMGGDSVIDPQAITEARRALGRQLATFRDAAGLIQGDLASLVHYGRSTIANVETGRQSCRRSFWESCDEVLRAGGALISAYEELKALERRQRRDIAREMNPERGTRMSDDGVDTDAQADVARGVEIAASTRQPQLGSLLAQGAPSGPRLDMVTLRLRLDGREVAVPVSRRLLLQAGIGSVVEAFAIGQPSEVLQEDIDRQGLAERITVDSPAYMDEVLGHLREQWYALVKTDNLLGPRFALAGVLNQIGIVQALLPALRDRARLDAASLGAQYAESAAWLYEDSGNVPRARYWTGRAMEWAYEADDRRMLAWTIFRCSQQVAATGDAPRAIGLAQAARRDEEHLATPTRAAIRVQEAYGHALDRDELAAQKLVDDAHAWAASDTEGDARGRTRVVLHAELHRDPAGELLVSKRQAGKGNRVVRGRSPSAAPGLPTGSRGWADPARSGVRRGWADRTSGPHRAHGSAGSSKQRVTAHAQRHQIDRRRVGAASVAASRGRAR